MKTKIKNFNATDVVILLAIIAIFCGIIFRSSFEKIVDSLFYKVDITYTVEITGADVSELKIGVQVFDSDGNNIGTVVKKDISDDHSKTVLVIETVGKHDSRGNYIGGSTFIAPGKQLDLCLENNKVFPALVKKVEYNS